MGRAKKILHSWRNTRAGKRCRFCGQVKKPGFDLSQCSGPKPISSMELRFKREQAMLPTVLFFLMQRCGLAGWEFRADTLQTIQVAIVAPFQGLDMLATRVESELAVTDAWKFVHCSDAAAPVEGLLGACMFIQQIIEQGRFSDTTNQAVLTSMVIWEEAREDGLITPGIERVANHMLEKASALGYYSKLAL